MARTAPDADGATNLFTDSVRDFVVLPGQINQFRLPPYVRLDVSLKYKTRRNNMDWTAYLQVFNIGNRRNVWFVQYKDDSMGGRCDPGRGHRANVSDPADPGGACCVRII